MEGEKILYFPLQSQKVFGICLAAGLGEGLSLAGKWVQQLRSGDWVAKSSSRGLEETMALFNLQGVCSRDPLGLGRQITALPFQRPCKPAN